MSHAKTIPEVIGRNVAAARKRAGMTQAGLGQWVGMELGADPWSRSTVSQAEGGQRAFVAAEIVALCTVLEIGLTDIFSGVHVPGPQPIQRGLSPFEREVLTQMRDSINKLVGHLDEPEDTSGGMETVDKDKAGLSGESAMIRNAKARLSGDSPWPKWDL